MLPRGCGYSHYFRVLTCDNSTLDTAAQAAVLHGTMTATTHAAQTASATGTTTFTTLSLVLPRYMLVFLPQVQVVDENWHDRLLYNHKGTVTYTTRPQCLLNT